jgi:hypothetical protein
VDSVASRTRNKAAFVTLIKSARSNKGRILAGSGRFALRHTKTGRQTVKQIWFGL